MRHRHQQFSHLIASSPPLVRMFILVPPTDVQSLREDGAVRIDMSGDEASAALVRSGADIGGRIAVGEMTCGRSGRKLSNMDAKDELRRKSQRPTYFGTIII